MNTNSQQNRRQVSTRIAAVWHDVFLIYSFLWTHRHQEKSSYFRSHIIQLYFRSIDVSIKWEKLAQHQLIFGTFPGLLPSSLCKSHYAPTADILLQIRYSYIYLFFCHFHIRDTKVSLTLSHFVLLLLLHIMCGWAENGTESTRIGFSQTLISKSKQWKNCFAVSHSPRLRRFTYMELRKLENR